MITRRSLISNAGLMAGAALLNRVGLAKLERDDASPIPASTPRASFSPGQVWLDTAGKPIQAHGGSILRVEDVFYWYGENKEGIVPGSGKWHNGVRCYSSTDFYNWTDLGAIIPAVPGAPSSPLNPSSEMDRPHIIYNAHTKKFVCWLKIIGRDGQTRTILTADSVIGPYTLIRSDLHPLGMSAGDFDLVIAPADHKPYQYYERVHSELICADLTDDYTDFTGYYSTHFPHPHPPEVREGPHILFEMESTTSPLPERPAISPTQPISRLLIRFMDRGPFLVIFTPPTVREHLSTLRSARFSSIRTKRTLYIALADRWVPGLPKQEGERFTNGDASRETVASFGKLMAGMRLTPGEMQSVMPILATNKVNTSLATYVWLPIRFDGERPLIEWREEWSLSDFA